MITRQKQRAAKYPSNIWLLAEREQKKKEKKERAVENQMKSNTASCWLENKPALHPPAAAVCLQVTETSLRLKICSLRCYDPSCHSSPRNQVAGSCDGQMHVGEKPSGCRSCSGSWSPLCDHWSTSTPLPRASAAWGAGTAETWAYNLVWMDTWHTEKVRSFFFKKKKPTPLLNAKFACTPHKQCRDRTTFFLLSN